MTSALLAAAVLAFSAADFPEDPACADEEAVHVTTNYHVCTWRTPPPMIIPGGGSDYSGYSGETYGFSRFRPGFTWQLRTGDALPLNEMPASVLEVEKELFRTHYNACRRPEAMDRLGEELARMRSERAYSCWEFLQNEEVRRRGAPRPEGRYDDPVAATPRPSEQASAPVGR